ncbi:hypothetical protein [Nitrobacter sp. JJSN]|jgi:hypothetical protein|uniref:hypothetical protein n=1 Tax=Nitrobacter sp. JJSN TaxID=3453033 RepID=UPI003F77802A
MRSRNPFDCATRFAFAGSRWVAGLSTMLETITAVFGIMSASIFLAHAIDGYWSRP